MAERKEYINKLAEQLKSWDDEIAKYQAKAAKVNEDARQRYQSEISKMKQRREQLQAKYEEVKKSSDDAWHSLKSGFEKSWTDLRNAFDEARSKFKSEEEEK